MNLFQIIEGMIPGEYIIMIIRDNIISGKVYNDPRIEINENYNL